jgi:c-di-GMP-binding flagellar brake protein YcgR
MATQPYEIITGPNLIGMLQAWIDSRRMGRMDIPKTPFSWITILLGIQRKGNSEYLLVDSVPNFESSLSRSPSQEVVFEILESGILCKFRSRVIRYQPREIWLELPGSIQRIQKRAYFRVRATSKAEIIFRIAGKEEKARVRDYSLGGVSFLMGSHQQINPGDEVTDLILTLPQGKAVVSYPIAQAIVRRIDEHFEGRGRFCGLEFLKLEKTTQQKLAQHLFEEQRLLLIQKRAYFRVRATSKAEIIFRIAGKEEKAQVRDYSLGGVSFLMGSHQQINPGDEVTDLILTLPQGKAVVSFPIAQAIVRRIDEHFEERGRLCGLEFLKLERNTQQKLARHLFEEQRLLLRQGRKI